MPAFFNCPRWWLVVASDNPNAAARSHVHTSPASVVNNSDINLIRTGSANALSRNAISSAASSSSAAADTGAQQIGAVISIVGNVFGMTPPYQAS